MKINYEKVNQFLFAAKKWKDENPEESPFKYAIQKVTAQLNVKISQNIKDMKEKIRDLEIECYATDPKTGFFVIIKGEKQQTPELLKKFEQGKRKIIKESDEEIKAMDFEVKPYFATSIPKLTKEQAKPFKGLVIK